VKSVCCDCERLNRYEVIEIRWLSGIENFVSEVCSKVKFATWPMSWQPPGTDQLSLRGPKVNSRIWLCTTDNSAIKIVLCNIIIIIMHILHTHTHNLLTVIDTEIIIC